MLTLALFLQVEAAQKLLSEAGYPDGKGFPEFELLYNMNAGHKKIAAAVSVMWKRDLGISAKLVNHEWKVYLDSLARLEFQIARRGWVPDAPDPASFLEVFAESSGNNQTGWSSRHYDALLSQASGEAVAVNRMKLLSRAEQVLIDEAPIIPLYHYANSYVVRGDVRGWEPPAWGTYTVRGVTRGEGDKPLRIAVTNLPARLDPIRAFSFDEHQVLTAVFEGLVNYDPRSHEALPGVAERWEVSGDGKTITFHLRAATWSNGYALTAGDFKNSWERALNPSTPCDYAHLLFAIKNAERIRGALAADGVLRDWAEMHDGRRAEAAVELPAQVSKRHVKGLEEALKCDVDEETRKHLDRALKEAPKRADVAAADIGIRVADDRTLVVGLERAAPQFLAMLSAAVFQPSRKGEELGNGPYRVKERFKTKLVLEPNPKYWDADRVKQSTIAFVQAEGEVAVGLFDEFEVDLLQLTGDALLAHRDRAEAVTRPVMSTYFYGFNVKKKPFDDVRVRRALSMVIDRKAICDALKGGQTPATGLVPPLFPGYERPKK
jgi:ABC-type oligopeptide transport system substrate-binding subunit